MDHGEKMDRIYRLQRHFYDVTRPLFLPGRDALLCTVDLQTHGHILEMGCGTARNLIHLARRSDTVRLYGIDASSQMLETARSAVRRAGLEDRIQLACAPAETLSRKKPFDGDIRFDTIFFSYSLTMMPSWRAALDAAATALRPGGALLAVDFMDLNRWPKPLRSATKRWLDLFHVRFDPEMPDALRERFPDTDIQTLWGGYAFLAVCRASVSPEVSR